MPLLPASWEAKFAFPQTVYPWWRAVFVSTIDGAAQDATGTSGSLGGDVDRQLFATLRSMADVIVVGAETARAEGYEPEDRPIAVVSRRLDIPEALAVDGAVVVTTAAAPTDRRRALSHLDIITAGETEIDWSTVNEEFTRRGWLKVQCEGGPRLFGSLVELDEIDELCLTVAPVLVAGNSVRIAHGVAPVAQTMKIEHAGVVEGVLLTRWVRDRG